MNPKYEKGKRFEQKLVREAREQGKLAFRSAGSHSPIDLAIIDPRTRQITFIQAKKGKSKMSIAEKQDFTNNTGQYFVQFKVVEG